MNPLRSQAGARVDALDERGRTALWCAVENDRAATVKLLIAFDAAAASAAGRRPAASVGAQTPLHLAAMLGHLSCARLLVAVCGADVNLQVYSVFLRELLFLRGERE